MSRETEVCACGHTRDEHGGDDEHPNAEYCQATVGQRAKGATAKTTPVMCECFQFDGGVE